VPHDHQLAKPDRGKIVVLPIVYFTSMINGPTNPSASLILFPPHSKGPQHTDTFHPVTPIISKKVYIRDVRCIHQTTRTAFERQLLQLWHRSVYLRNDHELKQATDSSRPITTRKTKVQVMATYAKEVVRSSVFLHEREENTLHSKRISPLRIKTPMV
jgi:hypothetical protein